MKRLLLLLLKLFFIFFICGFMFIFLSLIFMKNLTFLKKLINFYDISLFRVLFLLVQKALNTFKITIYISKWGVRK